MSIYDFFFGVKIVAEIDRGNASIKAIGRTKKYSGPADVAVKDGKVIALGDDCKNAKEINTDLQILNGFKHNRVIVGEFDIAEAFISGAALNLGMIFACHLRIHKALYILGYQQVKTQAERIHQMTNSNILNAAIDATNQNSRTRRSWPPVQKRIPNNRLKRLSRSRSRKRVCFTSVCLAGMS